MTNLNDFLLWFTFSQTHSFFVGGESNALVTIKMIIIKINNEPNLFMHS